MVKASKPPALDWSVDVSIGLGGRRPDINLFGITRMNDV